MQKNNFGKRQKVFYESIKYLEDAKIQKNYSGRKEDQIPRRGLPGGRPGQVKRPFCFSLHQRTNSGKLFSRMILALSSARW